MNERALKSKKLVGTHLRHGLNKNPSSSSIKHPQGHCLPKNPPNIDAYHHYAQPRKPQDHKENKNRNNNTLVRDEPKTKNVLLQGRKSNVIDEQLRKTQKRQRKGPLRSQWVSPDDECLGCHEHLSSQIFRPSAQNSVNNCKRGKFKAGQTSVRTLTVQEQLIEFERKLPSIAWMEDQESLEQLVKLEQEYSSGSNYTNYLEQQPHITWKRRALVLDWAMLLASELNCKREAFAVAVNILDRYLAATPNFPIQKLQLTTATCLMIAQKLEVNSRVTSNCFYEPISERHSFEELLESEVQISQTLKFRLRAPTIIGWANRLCAQWDLWIERKGKGVEIRFKGADNESYHNWRWVSQYIDFALLDVQTLQYKNRTLASSFLYLTLLLKLELHSQQQISTKFKQESSLILARTQFNNLYSQFLLESFGFPIQEILPTIQYCSSFIILPLRFDLPILINDEELSFEEYCGIQSWNECQKTSLDKLNRHLW